MSKLPEPIETYIEAYNRMDVDDMLACLADDVVFRNLAGGAVTAEVTSKRGFEALARQGVAAFRSRRQVVTASITVADTTLAEIDYEAVVAADLPNGWKAGEQLSFAGASLFELKHGKIARIVDQS